MRLFRAHLFSPLACGGFRDIPDGLLAVDDRGRIEAVGPFDALRLSYTGLEVEDLRPWWILPGMIDLHTHLPQLEAVAMDGLELLPWLETFIFPLEESFSGQEKAREGARVFFKALMENGTTTASIYCTIHEDATTAAFEEAERCGMRAVIGKVLMDRNAPKCLMEDTPASLAAAERLCERWHGRDKGRLQFALTPRFAPSCSRELMAGAARIAKGRDAFIQTHVGENLREIAWVQELFPESATYTEVYESMGLLGPRTLLAHGIHLTPHERSLIKGSGSAIIHCPRSNAFLGSGIMPLRQWLDEGLKVGLGTDVGAGPSLSMFAECAYACAMSKLHSACNRSDQAPAEKPISPLEAFRLSTLGGAEILGMADKIGSLEKGKDADFIAVDPAMTDPLGRIQGGAEQVLSRLLYRECPGMVKKAYVRGRGMM